MTGFQFILLALSVIGSLGLFLFGMKLMSESILKVTGNRIRSTISKITSDRWRGILTGFLSTSVLQSSTATTILTVSLVNAGLLTLPASISIIMGANIGTTITGWIVSLIGFNLQLSSLALPLIAFAIPLYLAGKTQGRSWAEFLIGFSLLFIALQLLKSSLPDVHTNPYILDLLSEIARNDQTAGIMFLIAGLLITTVLQSSSAVMSLTLVLATGGLISFHHSAAMIIGMNIGTTVSANLASIVANRKARIAARVHFLFNIIGALWAFPLLPFLAQGIDSILIVFGYDSPLTNLMVIPLSLSLFHTLFNVINVLLLAGFIKPLQKLGKMMVKSPGKEKRHYGDLVQLRGGLLSTSEIDFIQVRSRMVFMFDMAWMSLNQITQLLSEKDSQLYNQIFRRIKKNEKHSDQIEVDITNFLSSISSGNISKKGSSEIRKMVKIVDELETINDYCLNLASAIDRKNQQKIWFTQELRNHFTSMIHKVAEQLELLKSAFLDEVSLADISSRVMELEKEINQLRSHYRDQHLVQEEENEYSYQAGITFLTMVNNTEKMGDHCVNILDTMSLNSQPN